MSGHWTDPYLSPAHCVCTKEASTDRVEGVVSYQYKRLRFLHCTWGGGLGWNLGLLAFFSLEGTKESKEPVKPNLRDHHA